MAIKLRTKEGEIDGGDGGDGGDGTGPGGGASGGGSGGETGGPGGGTEGGGSGAPPPSDIDWSAIIAGQPENSSGIGPGGTDANGLTPQDWQDLWNEAGGGSTSDAVKGWLKTLGLVDANGNINPAAWMGALAPIVAGFRNTSAANRSTAQLQAANTQAMDFLKGQMGTQAALFKPYTDAGAGAVGKLQAMPASNLAAQFSPLGSGYGLGLSATNQMPRGSTFADIMAAKKPKGS